MARFIGVASDLQKRAWEHKNELVEAFKQKYGVHHLVYYEIHQDIMSSISWNSLKGKSNLEGFVGRNYLEG
jgi:putative endonuclease